LYLDFSLDRFRGLAVSTECLVSLISIVLPHRFPQQWKEFPEYDTIVQKIETKGDRIEEKKEAISTMTISRQRPVDLGTRGSDK